MGRFSLPNTYELYASISQIHCSATIWRTDTYFAVVMKNTLQFFLAVPVLVFSLVFVSPEISAQNGGELSDEEFRSLLQGTIIPQRDYTETLGTPYFNSNFENGSITFASGKRRDQALLKYNTYEDRLELSYQNRIFSIPGQMVSRFSIEMNGREYEFIKGFESRRLALSDFVMLLSDGPVKGLLKIDTSFQEAMATYGTATQRDEYVQEKTLYVHRNGSTERVRRLRERNIISLFDTHQDEIKAYITQSKLHLDNNDHLIELFSYYNSLLKLN